MKIYVSRYSSEAIPGCTGNRKSLKLGDNWGIPQ